LTGGQVLFVFAGDPPDERTYGVRHTQKEVVFYSPEVAVQASDRLRFPLPISRTEIESAFRAVDNADSLSSRHTLSIGDLKRTLGLSEFQIPCLHVTYLIQRTERNNTQIVPLKQSGGFSIYQTLKTLMERWEPVLSEIANYRRQLASAVRNERRYTQERARVTGWSKEPSLDLITRDACEELLGLTSRPQLCTADKSRCFKLIQTLNDSKSLRSLVADERGLEAHEEWLQMAETAERLGMNLLRAAQYIDRAYIERNNRTRRRLRPDSYARRLLALSPANRVVSCDGLESEIRQKYSTLRAVLDSSVGAADRPRHRDGRCSTFISYGGPDEHFAIQVQQVLRENGVETFLYAKDAVPGTRLHRTMRDEINRHDRVILICSRHSLDRPGVTNEIEESLAREAREGGSSVLIPIALDEYVFNEWKPIRADLAQAVRDRAIGDFQGADTDKEKLAKAMHTLLLALERP